MSVENSLFKKSEKSFAYPPTRDFFIRAYGSGATRRWLDDADTDKDPLTQRSRADEYNLIVFYFFSGLSMDEIGSKARLPISRERIRQIKNEVIEGIHGFCDPYLQDEFPLDKIPRGKPKSIYDAYKISKGLGGSLHKVMDTPGASTSYEAVRGLTSYPFQLRSVRNALKNYGVELPHPRSHDSKEVERVRNIINDPELSFQEVKDFLEGLSSGQIKHFMHKGGGLISMKAALIHAGIKIHYGIFGKLKATLEAGGDESAVAVGTYEINDNKQGITVTCLCLREVDKEKAKIRLEQDTKEMI